MKLKRNQQGFTIIEVVLVLAIAGLIFLMIFIALPALQRGQRDTARKNDVSTVAAAINTYKSNNKNELTGLSAATLATYVDSLNQYDKSSNITVSSVTSGSRAQTINAINVYIGAKCGTVTGANVTLTAGVANRTAAVATGLENNGSNTIAYCQDV